MRRVRSLAIAFPLALAVAGAVVVPGVSLAADPSPSAGPVAGAPAPSHAAPAPLPSLVPVEPATVELLDRGAAPRAERRFQYTQGQAEVLHMRMTQVVTSGAAGTSDRVALPPIDYRFQVVVLEVDDAGTATIDLTLTDVEAIADPGAPEFDEGTLATMNAALGGLVGLRVVSRITTRGLAVAAGTDLGAIDPALLQQLGDVAGSSNQLAAPLPEEAIGVGARWVTRGTASSNGLAFRTEQISTLRHVDGDLLRITATGTQAGIPGEVNLPTLPAGVTAVLDSLVGTLSASMTVDLARLVPTSRGDGTLTIELTVSDGTTSQQVESIAESTVMVDPGEE